jgi:trypsin
MKKWAVTVAIAAASSAYAGTPAPPIIGGQQATVGQFPSTVVIEVGNGLCTGTLVTKDWVLTAAHCVTPQVVGEPNQAAVTNSVKVHFGTVDLKSQGTVVMAADTIPNPKFSINSLGSSDIGLIKLKTPMTTVPRVTVNGDPTNAPIGIDVTMVGFGATAQGGGGNIGVEFVVAQKSIKCSDVGAGKDTDLLCFNQISGKGKCEGDSGGPSFAKVNGVLVQVGITSFGDQNCAQFGADTRTDAEKAFLLQHIPELICAKDSDCPGGGFCFQNRCIAQPFGTGGMGSDCSKPEDCDSATCTSSSDGQKCTEACAVGAADACPSGFDCIAGGPAGGLCWPNGSGGCCDAGGGGAPTMVISILLLGLALSRRRG